MKRKVILTFALGAVFGIYSAQAQVTMAPLTSFGVNGWLAPGSDTYLTTGSTERGLAFADNEVFFTSRASGNNIVAINPTTGALIGTLNNSGISGGTFAVDAAAAGGDGALYIANLTTSATTAFTVYEYANPLGAGAPTIAYTGNPIIGTRFGDTLAAIGSGTSTLLVAGSGAGSSGYEVVSPTTSTATGVTFTGSPPNAADFSKGITFTDSSHVIGTQGSSLYRYSSFSGTTGTLLGSPAIPDPAGATADRLMAYTVLNGQALLAVQSIGDSHVSIYNVSNPNSPVWLASGDNTTGTLAGNGNGTGDLAWGSTINNGDGTFSEDLYGLSTSQGIQAFVITVPEPGTLVMTALGLGLLACVRRFRK